MSGKRLPIALPFASSWRDRLAWSERLEATNLQTTPVPQSGAQL
jgi:hypothetical protein